MIMITSLMQQSVTKYYHDYDHYFNATISN